MSARVKITIADPSEIVRSGLAAVLKQARSFQAELHEIADIEQLRNSISWQKPDILIVNPAMLGVFTPASARKENAATGLITVALQTSLYDAGMLKYYDDSISLTDSADQINEKISRLISEPEERKRQESLSSREKEVISCIVQGLTNKQIADKLCLSPHTVITHRRNISSKLGIHSTAGLTIYAIVNKLVDIKDIHDPSEEE